jgi:hypothetical protein
MVPSRRGLGWGVVSLSVALAGVAAPPASAGTSAVEIVSPADGGLATGGSVRFRVRVAPGATSFRAWLDSTEITKRFSAAGRERIATIRAGQDGLRRGVNHFWVRSRRASGGTEVDRVRFVRARGDPTLLAVPLPDRRTIAGSVPLRVRVARNGIKVRATLNGRPVAGAIAGAGRVRTGVLRADHGLRFGVNVLKLTAVDEGGAFEVERRTIVVPRTEPIPAVGLDRQAKLGRLLRLDGRRTKAARAGDVLRYSWRMVQAPKGTKAKLRGAETATPRLVPDRSGRYRIRLTVTETPGKGAGAAGIPQQPASSSATLAVTAVPDVPPVGVPITTLAGSVGNLGVALGAPINQTYTGAPANLRMVALDRTDLSLIANNGYDGGVTGTEQLFADVSALNSSALVIITSPLSMSAAAVQDGGPLNNLNAAVAAIGGQALPANVAASEACVPFGPPCQGFTVIGVPGMACCNAQENPGLSPDPGDPSGNLEGYLQLDSEGNYTYVSGDYVPFSVQIGQAGPDPGSIQSTVTVGGNSYSGWLDAGYTGFMALVLDAGNLQPLNAGDDGSSPPVGPVSGPQSNANIADDMSVLPYELEQWTSQPRSLLFVVGVGSVQFGSAGPDTNALWNQFSRDQSIFGGHGFYINALNGSPYTFVGPGAAPGALSPWGRTASPAATGTNGTMYGVLSRNNLSQYYAAVQSPVPLDNQLPTVAYQPTVPWPHRGTPGHRAALACVGAVLGLPLPIEGNYTNDNIAWSSEQTTLTNLSYDALPPACNTANFNSAEFTDVQTQLETEFSDVATVNDLIADVQSPLGATQSAVQTNFESITQSILSSVAPPNGNAGGDSADVAIDLMEIAGAIPEVGEVFALTAHVMELARDTTNKPDGSPLVSDVSTAANQLGEELANRYLEAWEQMGHVGDILVTDWGKLRTAAARAKTDWAWTTKDTADGVDAVIAATQRFVYKALFPLAFVPYRFGDQQVPYAGVYNCFGVPESVGDFKPFAGEPNGGVTIVTAAGPTTDVWALGKADEQFLQTNAQYRDPNGVLPQSLYNDLFNNPVSDRVQAPPFASQLTFNIETYDDVRVITHDQYGECLIDGQYPPGGGGRR